MDVPRLLAPNPRRILLLALVVLASCAGAPEPIRGAGDEILPPAGWVMYCDRHPEDAGCRS